MIAGESFAESLNAFAEQRSSDLIVVGGARDGMFGGHVIGSVAGALLHCSPIPVALAPRGYAEDPPPTITAVTAAVPTRPGDDNPLPFAITLASAAELPIRMVSLVSAENLAEADSVQEVRQLQVAAAEENHAIAARALPDAPEIASLVADGTTLESALKKLKWESSDLLVVGSSRFAAPPGVPRLDGRAHLGRHRRAGDRHPPRRGLAFDHPPRRTCGHCEFLGRFSQWAHVREDQRLLKMMRCQSFSAAPVISLITCLIARYSSSE